MLLEERFKGKYTVISHFMIYHNTCEVFFVQLLIVVIIDITLFVKTNTKIYLKVQIKFLPFEKKTVFMVLKVTITRRDRGEYEANDLEHR